MSPRKSDGDTTSIFRLDMSPKSLQPRIVFVLLLIGSAAGVWLSRWRDSGLARGFWWLLVVAFGSLCGGLYWRLFLFDVADFDGEDVTRSVTNRWQRVGTVAMGGFLLGGVGSVAAGAMGRPLDIGELAIAVGVALSPILWVSLGRYPSNEYGEMATYLRWVLFAVVLGSLIGFAWTETGGRTLEWAVRVGHLGSFALWLGGAMWHNFVVLPMVRAHPEAAGKIKAQAHRFRRHLPAVIAVFFGTGVYQAVRLLGDSISALFGTPAGRLVATKLVVLAVLTGLVVASRKRARKSDRPIG